LATEKEVKIRISGKVDNSLNAVSQKVDKAFSKMMKVAKSATLVGGAAATAAVTGAIKAGSSFESQMSTVEAISGATEKQIEQLENKAKEMGATTQFTATESGQAMEYMAMAGWKTTDMLSGISGIMDLAAASGEDLAGTSDIVTDALTAFNLKAKDAAHFSDVLAQAASNSNTNVSMMGETFKYVAPIAGALDYSAEDTAVSIGLMANAGIKASQSGTALRRIMSNTADGITLVSKAYAKAGKKTGKYKIETANADGSMKDWSQTVEVLREQFSKMTEEEQAMNAESIAGKTAMSGLLAIVNASDKDYEKLTNSIDNASGAAERMAKIRLDNLQGDVTIFQSALEGKGIELYDELKEPMRDIVQSATDWLEEIDVARVVDDFKDFGGAVLDFAEPFLQVGEWMIKNPDAVAGPLAGIGSAIASYKLLDTVPKLGKGLQGLISGVTAHPYMAGGALVVGALTGISTAIANTKRAAENASLEDHFGDITLSMDQIQSAADNIIGSKKLEEMEKLMSSIKISEGFEREMKKAAESIEKIEWKVSAGLKLDDDDMKELEKSTQDYIQSAQDQIDQKGYTVNVATKVLFGNSARGKELIEENDSIFGALEMEAQGVAARLNSTLQEAMEKGLKPDIKKALEEGRKEMAELTQTMADAEAEASWDILKADFSGKDLDADTYKKMKDAINKNIETVEKTEKEARDTLITNARYNQKMGYISEEELQEEIDVINKQYEDNVKEAKAKGVEFQYNTLMDNYGEEIASGEYKYGDIKAIGEIAKGMSSQDLQGGEGEILKILDMAFNGGGDAYLRNDVTGTSNKEVFHSMASKYAKNYIDRKSGLSEEAEKIGDKSVYDLRDDFILSRESTPKISADTEAPRYGVDVAINEEEKGTSAQNAAYAITEKTKGGLQGAPVNILGGFVAAVPTAVAKMEEAAKKGGIASGEAFTKALSDEILKINPITIPVEMPVELISPVAPSTAKKGTKKSGGTSPTIFSPIRGNAEGIISTKAHIAAVSEGNKTEAIIPIDGSARSRRLYEATGKLMGYNKTSSQGVTFAPNINITLTGKASAEDKNEIRNLVQKELDKQYKKMIRDNKRFNMRQ